MSAAHSIQSLPLVVRFFESTYEPGSCCPHCGATGARIHHFQVADGRRLGAMSGCVKLFPITAIAREDLRLRKKEEDYAKKGYTMASWDQKIREVLESFYGGHTTEAVAMALIRAEQGRAKACRLRRGYR